MSSSPERVRISVRLTISPRGKRKTWTAEFRIGKRHCRQSLKTSNLRIAKARAADLDRKIDNGLNLEPPRRQRPSATRLSITDAIAKFASYCQTEGRRRRTFVRYRGMLTKFAEFAARSNALDLASIDMTLIDAYRAETRDSIGHTTKHHEITNLKRFLNWCEERSYIRTNPLGKMKFCPPNPKRKVSPTLANVNAVLEQASVHHRPIIALLAFTGMRSGEAQHLRVEDVDLKANWIHVVSRPGEETKNGESRKTPIHPRLREILERLPKKKAGYFFNALPSRYFPLGDHHINPKHLNDTFKTLLSKLELPTGRDHGFTIHSLRRFFRTEAVNASVPERVVDIWIGHAADKRVVQTVYYDLSDEKSQEFIKKVPFGDGNTAADVREGEQK